MMQIGTGAGNLNRMCADQQAQFCSGLHFAASAFCLHTRHAAPSLTQLFTNSLKSSATRKLASLSGEKRILLQLLDFLHLLALCPVVPSHIQLFHQRHK